MFKVTFQFDDYKSWRKVRFNGTKEELIKSENLDQILAKGDDGNSDFRLYKDDRNDDRFKLHLFKNGETRLTYVGLNEGQELVRLIKKVEPISEPEKQLSLL